MTDFSFLVVPEKKFVFMCPHCCQVSVEVSSQHRRSLTDIYILPEGLTLSSGHLCEGHISILKIGRRGSLGTR